MAFVVLTGGSTPEGVITVSAGAFNAPQVVGKTGSGDVTDNVFISGGTFTADPTEFVSENSPLAKITKSGVATYAIGGDISGAATGTVPGDTVEVLSGSIALQGLAHGVTVTNSGTGNVSANGTPVGSTSIEVHNLTHYEAVLPTHLTTGNIEYWYCGDCGKYFSDAGITEIPQKQTITDKTPEHAADGTGYHYDSNGHWLTCACGSQFDYAAHNLVFVVDVYATDSFNGYGHYECTDCDYESGRVTTYPAQTEPDTPSDPDDTVIVDEEEIEIEDPIEGGFAQTELVVLR